ncbi:hypothetical protein K0B96_07695 [Horticoccus luteus]|uniref:Glycosyltransferase subfamily 4-like N-terminal domain-containing protein n=1 Tax=Horticoccus luteus TaxID=2862869 RepID=A0A8F9TZ06_9BACT|nr:hypothetical protein [Horticoccus luteus]QYM80479.1 hypothetical protein K0B96_07695 [Horticoccus luteus]
MRRVLIVSPHFPPVNAPDMQRVRMSVSHYRALGWEPVILCVAPTHVDATHEDELAATMPTDLEVHRCGAWSRSWTKYIGLGTLGLRCWLPLYLAGRRILRRSRIDLVFLSNTQFVTFSAARLWQQEFGVPYLFDLQDPWRTDHYQQAGARRPPGGWKYLLARAMAWALEEFSFSGASAAMSVSGSYFQSLHQRYVWSRCLRSSVIGFGVSEQDFVAARTLTSVERLHDGHRKLIHLVNTGAAGPIMPHALNALLTALASFRATAPDLAAQLRLHFIGTSYVARGQGKEVVMPVARHFGVADLVHEVPHRIGHLESLALQLQADGLLLLGSSDPAYSPSKTFPYFLSRRPMLAVTFEGSQLSSLLNKMGGAFEVSLSGGGVDRSAVHAIEGFFRLALEGFPPARLPLRREAYFAAHYRTEVLATRQTELFHACLQCPASRVRLTV